MLFAVIFFGLCISWHAILLEMLVVVNFSLETVLIGSFHCNLHTIRNKIQGKQCPQKAILKPGAYLNSFFVQVVGYHFINSSKRKVEHEA